jgi:hypothetical protein
MAGQYRADAAANPVDAAMNFRLCRIIMTSPSI